MRILDYRDRPLASRIHAADDLLDAQSALADSDDLIVDLGSNLATTSWVDGFLVPVARKLGSSANIAIVSDSEVTRSHVRRVFASRGLRARVSRTRAEALDGRFDLLPTA
jgi:hypothetical protein